MATAGRNGRANHDAHDAHDAHDRGGVRPWIFTAALVAVAACTGGSKTPEHRSREARLVDGGVTSAASRADASAAGEGPVTGPGLEELASMTIKQACSLSATARGTARPGAAPYSKEEGSCDDPFCDFVLRPPKGADACFVAASNLSRAERESRAAGPGRVGKATSGAAAWDGQSPPKYWDRVDAHLHLDADEATRLRKNHFVVLDRTAYDSYAVAFHDVFQQQLPVYISVDSVFNAIYRASETLLGGIERQNLTPRLVRMLGRMRATLAQSAGRYDATTLQDLDVYLLVAQRLLHATGEPARAKTPEAEEIATELTAAAASAERGLATTDLFGRARVIDFSQFAPRGHYASTSYEEGVKVGQETINPQDYFRAMMWLSRIELNLVSRSCRSSQPGMVPDPSETPREARDAIALADLVARSGSAGDLRVFEDVYSVFAGRREDVSLLDLGALATRAKIGPRDAEAPSMLRAAIGTSFRRTARTHYMPEGAPELPAITTMFGPRIVPDVAPLARLVHDSVPNRTMLGAADVAYVLGHDRAKAHLASDLARHPELGAALELARAEVTRSARDTRGAAKPDVYSAWLSSVIHAADPPAGVVPSFMKTDAYADMRISTSIAAYAQIRHTYVLVAGQGYDAYGCEIPDGWVEPAVPVYDALLAWVKAARSVNAPLASYFRRVEEILGMLRAISVAELAGAPLTEPQRRWLGMVAEYVPVGGFVDSGAPPKWTGWYFDLFPDREHGAEAAVDLVADYFTLTNAGVARYVGVEKAALGVFVVDTGGGPRAMVGPVVKPYETSAPLASRLDDEHARKLEAKDKQAPWLASYLSPKKSEPPLAARLFRCSDGDRVVAASTRPLGDVTVTLLDHHGDAIASAATRSVGADPTAFAFTLPDAVRDAKYGVEGVHVHVHDRSKAGLQGSGRWDVVLGVSSWRTTVRMPADDTDDAMNGFGMSRTPALDASFFDATFGGVAGRGNATSSSP